MIVTSMKRSNYEFPATALRIPDMRQRRDFFQTLQVTLIRHAPAVRRHRHTEKRSSLDRNGQATLLF